MLVAITGGTGFLGGQFARYLVANGHFAKLLARGVNHKDEGIRKLPNMSFTPILFTDDRKLGMALTSCDAVAHLVGINREATKGDYHRVHVESTIKIIHAARKASVKKIILVTYLKARPRCFSSYLESKWEAEEIVRNCELDYTILKPPMIFGPGDHMISHISKSISTVPIFAPVGLLQKKIRPVAVQDMCKLMLTALTTDRLSRQTFAVLGPEEVTLGECVKRVAKVMHKPVLIAPAPSICHYMMATVLEKASNEPLVSLAQVRMLSEDMSKPLKNSAMLPDDLRPSTPFDEQQIKKALGIAE